MKEMFIKKTYAVGFAIAAIISFIQAQNTLTADDAVAIALKSNFGILVARNAAEIARINNAAGNAGMLPTVAASGSGNYSFNAVEQKLPNVSENHNSNVESNTINAGIELNWTLFDGGKMFVTKNKLGKIESFNKIQYKDKVQKSVFAVIAAYYDIVRQKQELVLLNEVIAYNTDRVTILRTSFNAGLSPKTNFLQAQIDLNVNRENAINQKTVINAAKRTLNQLLARDASIDFDVQDSIPTENPPDTSQLNQKLYTNNTDVQSLQRQFEIAKLTLSENRTLRYPRLSLNAGYDFLRMSATEGSIYGPFISATVSLPLYQAGSISRQIATAKLSLESARFDLLEAQKQIAIQARNTLDDLNNQRQLLLIEKENTGLAKENLDISMERLRLGQSTSLELRQAQESYEQARTRLINIQYSLKIAGTRLKQLLAEL